MTCVLCEQPLDGDEVPFGLFFAHAGCYEDWTHEEDEQQRYDNLESQEQ